MYTAAAPPVIKIIVMNPVLSEKCSLRAGVAGGVTILLTFCEIVRILSSIGSSCAGPWKGMITGTLNSFNILWQCLFINISMMIIIFSRAIRDSRNKKSFNEIFLKHSSSRSQNPLSLHCNERMLETVSEARMNASIEQQENLGFCILK